MVTTSPWAREWTHQLRWHFWAAVQTDHSQLLSSRKCANNPTAPTEAVLLLLGSHSSSIWTALGCQKVKYKGLQEAQDINFTNRNPSGWKGTLFPTVPEPPAPLLWGDTPGYNPDRRGLSVHDPHDQQRQEEAQETAMGVSTGSMHENCSALLPLPQETWLRWKPLLCQQRGIHEGDPSHHCIFTDEMGKGRMRGWRSGQLLKCNWCNDSVLQNETLSHLFQVIPPIPPRGEGTGLPCRAAGGRSPPLPAHLPGSSPGEFPGQVPANASAPAGDQHVLLGQVSQLGWQHQAHGSFHHQIHHLHREQQQGAQPLPDHRLLPGKVLFQTSTKPRWQRTKSNTLHAPPDGWQVFNPLPKLGGKRFLDWKNPSLPLKKMKVGVK